MLCSIWLKEIGQSAEIRRTETCYYVTTGNLFGSQTLKVTEVDSIFRLLGAARQLNKGQQLEVSKFPGVEILEGVVA